MPEGVPSRPRTLDPHCTLELSRDVYGVIRLGVTLNPFGPSTSRREGDFSSSRSRRAPGRSQSGIKDISYACMQASPDRAYGARVRSIALSEENRRKI